MFGIGLQLFLIELDRFWDELGKKLFSKPQGMFYKRIEVFF